MSGNQCNNTDSDSYYSEHLQAIGLYCFCRTAPWEFYFHLGFQFFYSGSGFNDLVLYGLEGSILKLGTPEHLFLEGMKQDICHRVQEQSELVRLKAMTGRTVTSQIQLMLLDPQFHSTSGTVAFFIQIFCPELNQVGNYIPDIGSHFGDLNLDNHLLWLGPASGLVRKRMVSFDVLAVLLKFPFSRFNGCRCHLMQSRVSTHSGDVTSIILLFTPPHKIRRSKMAVTPNNDYCIDPFFPEVKNQLFQKRGNITLLTSSSRLEDRGNQLARETFIDMQGHVAVISVIMVVKVLLLPVGIIVGVITIQDDDSRFPVVRLYKDVYQFLPYAIQILTVNRVLQTAHRRLGGQRIACLWRPTSAEFEDYIITQIITVVTVFISRCYLGNTLGKHLNNRMVNVTLISIICNTVAYTIDQPHMIINLTQKKQSAIAADIISGEADLNLFVLDWKKLV